VFKTRSINSVNCLIPAKSEVTK